MAARLPQLLAERLLSLIPTSAGGLARLSTLAATAGAATATAAAAANGGPAAVSPLVYP